MIRLQHRLTSLEQWGMRRHADFQPEAVACVKEAGFTGVYVNGGSGIGPDMLTPESLVESSVIPDLMPLTVQGNQRQMQRRCELLAEAGLRPWLCFWGVPGPDDSTQGRAAASNRFFHRRSKLEMNAKLARDPELFGARHDGSLSWRGIRPLCVSHPTVQAFYEELGQRLPETWPALEGVFYFPGDSGAEICHDCCPRCAATGLDQVQRMVRHINRLYNGLTASKPGLPFYVAIWNQDGPQGQAIIETYLSELDPGIGICMTLTDNYVEQRRSGPMVYNQPWVTFGEAGEAFLSTYRRCHEQERPVMVLAELSQAEIWDPVCHNMPNPTRVLDLLGNANDLPGVNAVGDFWGHRGPFHSHANHAAMRAWLADPKTDKETLLARAARHHYELGEDQHDLLAKALACWQAFDETVANWALNVWTQRFSYAIGRDSARGFLYAALLPRHLRLYPKSGVQKQLEDAGLTPERMCAYQREDRPSFLASAAHFDGLADALEEAGLPSASLARREARNIELAGELIASIGRFYGAFDAWDSGNAERLRAIIAEEIEARMRQQEISGRIGWGAGVNPILVDEDIQNMRLYLSSDDFPETPDEVFHFTETPYSV